MDSKQVRPSFRILQIIANLEIGGAQEVVRTLSANLQQCGHPVVVCSFQDGPLRVQIERTGTPVEILNGRNHAITSPVDFTRDMLRIRSGLSSVIQQYQINVVQTHLLRSLDYLVLTLKNRRSPLLVFWTVHNSQFALRADQLESHHWLLKPKRMVHRILYRSLANKADGFIAVSDDVSKSIYASINPSGRQVAVISNGVDTLRYLPRPDQGNVKIELRRSLGLDQSARLALVVGTLKEQKGHRFLIEAAAPLLKNDPNLHLVFAGDGPLRQELETQVNQTGISESIHFLGNRTDIPAILAGSDYFILPSLWEGLPMALIEAMAAGLPVIATRVSGSLQVISHENTGLLVTPGDSAELRQAITLLLSDIDRAKSMGRAAREYIDKHFGARKQAEEHLELYRREWMRRFPHAIY